jgi:hypothetical protein
MARKKIGINVQKFTCLIFTNGRWNIWWW